MEFEDNLKNIASHLSGSANVKSVYGDAVQVDGKTVIPVAKVAYAFGAGHGSAKGKESTEAGGEGGAGGVTAKPLGVIEITEDKTRFVPVVDTTKIIAAALAAFLAGINLGRLFARKRH